MATTYSAVDGNAITITTDEIELAKRGGVVVATDGKAHELVVTVTAGRNGWVNVNVAESASWSKPLDFGFLPAGKESRWSYNNRPNQIVVDAMKKVRTAQAKAQKAIETENLVEAQQDAVLEAEQALKSDAPVSTIAVRKPIKRSDIPAARRTCERCTSRTVVVFASIIVGEHLLSGHPRTDSYYLCVDCLEEKRDQNAITSIAYVEA